MKFPRKSLAAALTVVCLALFLYLGLVGHGAARRARVRRPRGPGPYTVMLTYSSAAKIPAYKIAMWEHYHPGIAVRAFGDRECRAFLAAATGEWAAELFDRLPYGPIKADLFRVAYLCSEGGAYGDVDMEVHDNLLQYCSPECFNSVRSDVAGQVNNTFIFCPAGHWIARQILEEYKRKGEGGADVNDYWGMSVGMTLKKLMDAAAKPADIDAHPWCLLAGGLALPFWELPSREEIMERRTRAIVIHNRSDDYRNHVFLASA